MKIEITNGNKMLNEKIREKYPEKYSAQLVFGNVIYT